jgi:hypothetical protein
MKRIFGILLMAALLLPVLAVTHKTIDGSPASVQAAINAAAPGSTVEIANGTYTWTSGVHVDKAIKLKGQSKGGVIIKCTEITATLIGAVEPNSGNLQIADLDFQFSGQGGTFAISVGPSSPRGTGRVLVHDCNFKILSWGYAIRWTTNGGVIWNCDFDGSANGGMTGIGFKAPDLGDSWQSLATFGTGDRDGLTNTYVEDCIFRAASTACTDFDDNSRVVVRHCIIDNALLGSHGQETSPMGVRTWEVYDNEFKCRSDNAYNMNAYFGIRGGTGVITDNDFEDIPGKGKIAFSVFSIRRLCSIPCQTQYPAARQVGQGWIGEGGYSYPNMPADGSGYFTDPICIWNNRGAGASSGSFVILSEYHPDECGNNQQIADYVKLGRDYKLEPRSNYQKYPYPHPLRGGGGGSPTPTPTPTPMPTSTPTPTPMPTPAPTPQPTPTPEPTPGATTYQQWLNDLGRWIEEHPSHPDE